MPLSFIGSGRRRNPASVWTFNGTIRPKLVSARYGERCSIRHHNGLPVDIRQTAAFGIHTISTHEHNGHHGAENDGFAGEFFFPNQFSTILAIRDGRSLLVQPDGSRTTTRRARPNDAGGTDPIPGDWHETMGTHWFTTHVQLHGAEHLQRQCGDVSTSTAASTAATRRSGGRREPPVAERDHVRWGNLDYDVT